jgi:fluoroquinolone resistance protein
MQLVETTVFKREDYTLEPLPFAEYDNCSFIDCNFDSSNLTGIVFTECRFESCNLGMANVKGTAFKDVTFIDCKLVGLNFSVCDPFLLTVKFEGCLLQLASFYKLKMKNTKFIKCGLQEADFNLTDLTGATFSECDLKKAVFDTTILEKADFRTAYNYALDPELNRLKKARFGREGIAGLLLKYGISIE